MRLWTFVPCGAVVKNPSASAGDIGDSSSTPGPGRSPEVGNGNLLQYSWLENPMDREAWWATVHGVTESWTQLSDWARTHIKTQLQIFVWKYVFISLGCIPGNKISQSHDNSMFNFLSNYPPVSTASAPFYISTIPCMRGPTSLHSCQYLLLSVFYYSYLSGGEVVSHVTFICNRESFLSGFLCQNSLWVTSLLVRVISKIL